METNKGLFYAIGSYAIWGLLPLFWRLLQDVLPGEILAHRIVWACVLTIGLVVGRKQWGVLWTAARKPGVLRTFSISAVLLSLNWFVYIWAVNNGHVIETSLGYFINPLVSVLLGMLFLGERLRLGQGIAVGLALVGVIYLTIVYGAPPWIALLLAVSFGIYGLLRKTASLESLVGLTLETLLIAPFALGFLIYQELTIGGAFVHGGLGTSLLLACSGVVTAVPLLLFAAGARRLTLTAVGITQYIAPTLQFLLGVLLFGEPLTPQRLIGFVLIWLALLVYSLEGVVRSRQVRLAALASEPVSR
jgi:chloramphenicol-sensitive protein RarD